MRRHLSHRPQSSLQPRGTMNRRPLVSIVIPNFNAKNDLRRCLTSLRNLKYDNKQVIVVDSGSIDGSAQMVADEFPEVMIIKTEKMGIGEANNIGIRAAKGDMVVFDLNSDDVVDKEWLTELVKSSEASPNIGIVCGKRLVGKLDCILDSAGGKIHFLTGRVPAIGRGRKDSEEFNVMREVDYVGVPMVKREVFEKIGLCDPEYYLYYEDSDFCLRARNAGYRVLYVPSAVFKHRMSSTVGKQNPRKHFYERRNRIRFMIKNFPSHMLILPLLFHMILMTLLYSSIYSIKANPRYIYAEKEAVLWNCRNLKRTIQLRYSTQTSGLLVD
jgi:GT2 family glycosyltransferase